MNDMADVSLHEFTVDEYHRIADLGLFADHRVELLDGIIVDMSPIGGRHWRRHAAVTEYLHRCGASTSSARRDVLRQAQHDNGARHWRMTMARDTGA